MGIGWMINSAMVLVAAAVFFTNAVNVEDIQQAQVMLEPLLGKGAALIFAFALLFSGIASTTTAGMAGGSIYAGIFGEAYDIKDYHSWHGVAITYLVAWLLILVITDPFQGLIYSQIALSMQLPITVFLQIYLTSSKRVMGKYANTYLQKSILAVIALVITGLNILLLQDFFG
jgi:manganese transport protein